MVKFSITALFIALSALRCAAAVEDDDYNEEKGGGSFTNPLLGMFELVTDPEVEDFGNVLTAMEFDDESKASMQSMKTIIFEISKDKNTYSVKVVTRRKTIKFEFQSGEEFDLEMMDGRIVKCKILVKGRKVTRAMQFETFEARQTFDFDENGVRSVWNAKGFSATLDFKRVTAAPPTIMNPIGG